MVNESSDDDDGSGDCSGTESGDLTDLDNVEEFMRDEGLSSDDEIFRDMKNTSASAPKSAARPKKNSHPTHSSAAVTKKSIRNGYALDYKSRRCGTITQWRTGLSCKCHIHPNCSLPAMPVGRLSTDLPFVDWLLMGVTVSGKSRLSKEKHLKLWTQHLKRWEEAEETPP